MAKKSPRKSRKAATEKNNNQGKVLDCPHAPFSHFTHASEQQCSASSCSCRGLWQCGRCQLLFCGAKAEDHVGHHTKLSGHIVVKNVRNGRIWCTDCEFEVSLPEHAGSSSTEPSVSGQQVVDLARKERGLTAHSLRGLSTRGRPLEECALESRPLVKMGDDDLDNVCPRGLTGLLNLGNTCYFNAALQVLSNCTPFSTFFRHKNNMRPWAVKQPVVANATTQLIQKIWAEQREACLSPSLLLMRIREEFTQFRGWAQQDAQELIRCLLDLLHRELGQPVFAYEHALASSHSVNGSTASDDGNGDSGMSSESELSGCCENGTPQLRTRAPEKPVAYRSIVTETFDGQLESSVRCLTCNNVSTTTETFQDLSLPIPSRELLDQIESMSGAINEEHNPWANKQQSWWTSWGSWARWWSSWVFPHAVSLDDCLEAFFCPDRLVGEDMYSCEKCKKLRNGVKTCRVSKLPEVLCVHLKRFRHDNFSSSKVWTRVDFPLFGLDLSRWTGNAADAQYELCGVIAHEGGGADSGHYIAYCRNEIDSNWYEFDDTTVTKLDPAYVLTKEAYVLVYQRTATPRVEQVRDEAFAMLHPARFEYKREATHFISTEWLERLGTFAVPGPITNHSLLCRHGHLNPRRTEAIPHLVTRIAESLWDLLYEEYGGGPELPSLHYCLSCEKRLKYLTEKKKKEWEQFRSREESVAELFSFDPQLVFAAHLPPCLISTVWFNNWKKFIRDPWQDEPGPIENTCLLEQGADGRPRLRRRPSAVEIPRECFLYLQKIYGGGPEVFLVDGQQPTEQMVRESVIRAETSLAQKRAELLAQKAVQAANDFAHAVGVDRAVTA